MQVLVTGGAGFIGSHTVRALVRRGDGVRVLDDLSTGRRERLEEVRDAIHFVHGDLRDGVALEAALDGATHVLHLAALPSVSRSIADPYGTHDVNTTGTLRLLEACRRRGVRRVVVASSSSVYGDQESDTKHEALPPRPASPYAASKLATEAYALAWSRSLGMEALGLRYFNVFGPGQDPAGEYAAVIPRFIVRALAGEVLEIYGDGLQSRDFTYVDNVVEANLLALDAAGVTGLALNVACGSSATLLELVEQLTKLLGRVPAVCHLPPRPGDVRHSRADLVLTRQHLGYQGRIGFGEGLRRTFASFSGSGSGS